MEALHVWDNHGGCKSRIDFKLRINTDHFKLILKRYNSHRGRALLRSLSISTSPVIEVVRYLTIVVLWKWLLNQSLALLMLGFPMMYAAFHTANDRYSGNNRYSGIKSPDRFFHYSGRCLYFKAHKVKTYRFYYFSFILLSKLAICFKSGMLTLWSYQKALQQTKSEFSFKSYGNTGFKAPPFHWSKCGSIPVFKPFFWAAAMLCCMQPL